MRMIIDSCYWDIGIYMMLFIIAIMLPLNLVFGGKRAKNNFKGIISIIKYIEIFFNLNNVL